MPYLTRKRIKLVRERPPILEVDLNDDESWDHYHDYLDTGIRYLMRGTVVLLTDKDDNVTYFVGQDYEFQVPHYPAYYTDKGVQYDRRLRFPDELVNGYRVGAGMGIELILREFVIDKEWLQTYVQSRKMERNMKKLEKQTGKPEEIFPEDSEAEIEMIRKEAEKYVKIFSEIDVIGVVDFEPKGLSEGLFATSEFLIVTKFSDEFYDKMVLEINNAFRVGLLTATIVLVRKLFERLIIDLLRTKYGMRQKELFYSEEDGGFHNLSRLIRELRKKLDDFKPYDFFRLEREKGSFLNFLWNIKKEGGAGAHSIYSLDRNGISDLKPSINKYSELLNRMIQKVKETPK
jgi:hypothetical protein